MGDVHGFCAPGWEGVHDAFAANIEERWRGRCGLRRPPRRAAWSSTCGAAPTGADTLQLVFSTTKGWTAALANLLVERGELDVDAPVASYWPEFAAEGKGAIPVRWLLTHQAGLPFPTEPCTLDDVLVWDGVVAKLAASTPVWEPGTAHGYHAVTYGFLVGEVLRRITGRTVGELLPPSWPGRSASTPDIGLPVGPRAPRRAARRRAHARADRRRRPRDARDARAVHRARQHARARPCRATAASPRSACSTPPRSGPPRSRPPTASPTPARCRASTPPSSATVEADERFPGGGRVLAPDDGGRGDGRQTTGNDRVLLFESTFGLGFMTSSPFAPYGGPAGFGHAGAGGSVGFADPEHGLGCGYVMSKMQQNLTGDPRSTA